MHLADFATANKMEGERQYISKEGIVWGIMVPGEFKYPKQGSPINSAYPDFVNWSKSGGLQNTSWYNNPSSYLIYSEN